MSALAAYARNHADSAADIVARHTELVRRIGFHLVARLPESVDVDDLIQTGMIGLLDAASSFDATQGASFETYASIRVRGAMIDEIRRNDWAPRSVHRRLREVSDAIRDIEQRSGRAARPAEIAARMKVTLDEYHKIVSDAARCQVFSIDETAVDDEGPRREPQGHAPGPMQLLEQAEFRGSLAEAIDDLPERERLIMALYYQDELNLREIGSILEVSESRVCQIHGQALTRLRARMAEHLQRPTAAAQRR